MPRSQALKLQQQTFLIDLFGIQRITETPPKCCSDISAPSPDNHTTTTSQCTNTLSPRTLRSANQVLNTLIENPIPNRGSWEELGMLVGVVFCADCRRDRRDPIDDRRQVWLNALSQVFGRDQFEGMEVEAIWGEVVGGART